MLIRWLRSLRCMFGPSETNSRRERRARWGHPHLLLLERLEDRTVPTFVGATGSPISMPAGFNPYSVAAADLNGDGMADLAFGNGSYPGVSNILEGQGNGTFQSAGTITIGTATPSVGFVRNVAAVDLTNDGGAGLPDLIAAEFGGNALVILQNTTASPGAAPAFSVADTIGVGSAPFWVTTGDFSGDGLQDIATANFSGNNITIIPNTSTGPGNISFGTPITVNLPAGSDPRSVVPIELNGKLDLVTANWNNSTLSILQNTSTGPGNVSFSLGTTITLQTTSPAAKPMALVIGDFNNDGQPDIAAASFDSPTSGDVYVLLNQNGTFPSYTRIPITGLKDSIDVAAADFNGDGNTDLAVIGQQSANVAVLYGNGAGAFPTVETYAVGATPWEVASADFNGDGAPDLVVANEAGGTASVLLNQSAATALQVTPSTTTPNVNTNFTVTVTAQANGAAYQNYDGAVTLTDANGQTLGTHTFVPADHGSYTFTVSLPDAEAATITASDGTLTGTAQLNSVDPPITLGAAPPADTIDIPYDQTIGASGGTGTLTLTSNMQNAVPGLVIPSSGAGSLEITGTPTASGTETFSVTATDAYGGSTTTSYTIAVNAAPTLSALSTLADTINVAFNQTITASGGTGVLTLTVSDVENAIPGLNLPSSGTGSLAITGTPTAAGTETFEVTATDSLGASSPPVEYSITVRNAVPTLGDVVITSGLVQGSQATLTGTINAPANQPLTLDVNWGDGSTPQTFDLPAGATTFSEPYTYANTGTYAVSVTVGDSDFSNDLLYGSTGGAGAGQLYVFDLTNQSVTLVGSLPGGNVTEIAANTSTGQDWLEYGNNKYSGQQFDIDTGSSVGGAILNATQENFNALTYIGNTLYAAGSPLTGGTSPSSLFTLDPATGQATLIGATGINGPVSGIAFDTANSTLFGIEGGNGSVFDLVSLDLTTGAATNLISTGFAAGSLSFGPDGNLYAGSSAGQLYSIDLENQTVTPLSLAALPSAVSGLTIGNDTANISVTVNPADQTISFTAPTSPITFVPNETITLSASASSGGTVAFSIDASSTGAGAISGNVLTVTGAGSFIIDANQAGDANFNAAPEVQQTLVVNPAVTLSPASLPADTVGVAYNHSISASGGTGTVTLTVSSIENAIAGLSVPGSGAGSLTIGGAPTVAGTETFMVTATDSLGNTTGPQQYSVTVNPAATLTLTPATLSPGAVNSSYGPIAFSASGGYGAYTFTLASGNSLPPGLKLSGGSLSGTPTMAGTFSFTVVVTDTSHSSLTGQLKYSMTVTPTLAVSPTTLGMATVGDNFQQQLKATGGSGTGYVFTSSDLPAGLTLSSAGLLSGTPTANSSASFTVTVADSNGATRNFKYALTIDPALTLAPSSLPVATVGDKFSKQLSATGGSGRGYVFTGASLPTWLTLSSAGLLSGTPSATAGGSSVNFTVTATDSAKGTGSTSYTLTVDPALVLSPGTLGVATVGNSFSAQLTATGGSGSGYKFAAGSHPAWLTVSSSGLLSGTPTAAVSFSFIVTVTDASSGTVSATYFLKVDPALVIKPVTLPMATVGDNFQQQLTPTGGSGAGYFYTPSGFPTWLTLSSTGLLSGTPTSTNGSPLHFTITLADSTGATSTAAYALTIDPALAIGPGSLPVATVGDKFSQQLAVAGGAGKGYTFKGAGLPSWLTLSAAGLLSGTPPTTAGGSTVNFTVTATDSAKGTVSTSYTLTIDPPLVLHPSTLTVVTVGNSFSMQLTATGGSGSGYTFKGVGLPAWLSVSSSGLLSGTPTSATGSPFSIVVTATDASGGAVSLNYALTVKPALVVRPVTLPVATVGDNFQQPLTPTGGSGKGYVFAASGLPAWLTLSSTGLLSGTPSSTDGSPLDFTITLTDSNGATGAAAYALTIDPALSVTPGSLPAAAVGNKFRTQLIAAGGSGSGYFFKGIGFPTWLTVTTNGVLTGTPPTTAASSSVNFAVMLTDSAKGTVSVHYTLTIDPALVLSPTTLNAANVGNSFSQELTATGGSGTGFSFTAVNLPSWLTLSSTGSLSGTPTTAAGFTFTATATDSDGDTVSHTYSLIVKPQK